jgi:two-component system, OmpR family, osmolarity sensor histidine kinase EnvZ
MWWPKTLFVRLVLLMLGVILLAIAVTGFALREERERQVAQQFSQTKIAQIQGIQNALTSVPRGARQSAFAQLARDYNAVIVPVERRPEIGTPPRGRAFALITQQLRSVFGEGTEVRLGAREGRAIIWIRLSASDQSFWVGLPAQAERENFPWRIALSTIAFLALLLGAAYWFARRAAQPLKLLANAATALGRGQPTERVPETGPAEVAAVAKGFNQLRDDLAALENERALMLAGVSHDLRTPLTRLKLELEMASLPDSTRQAMALEVEEIERTLGQFLDFAKGRHTEQLPLAPLPLHAWLSERVARECERRGPVVTLLCADDLEINAHAQSLDRALANVIDNAFRYGSASVDVNVARTNAGIVIELADRGPGIPEPEVERLLQPFTRGNTARSNAGGAGLGLSIVQRIVRLHSATMTIGPREGGGACVRLTFPSRN